MRSHLIEFPAPFAMICAKGRHNAGVPVVAIALGSNVGDAESNLRRAVAALRESIEVIAMSPLYRTAPMYVEDQPEFVNGALLGRTPAAPRELLAQLKNMEQDLGRLGRQPNGPREIDLDLIAYGALSYRFEGVGARRLQIPHPKVVERRFVLAPLADIAPDLNLPGLGRVLDLLTQTNDQAESVIRLDHADLSVQR